MSLDLPAELEAKLAAGFEAAEAAFMEDSSAPADEEAGPTPDAPAADQPVVEAAQQEKEQAVQDGPTPTEAPSVSADVNDPIQKLYEAQPQDYRDLVEKYRAGGMSLSEAMTKANAEQAPAYWERSRAKAAEAKAAKQAETPDPAPPAAAETKPAETAAEQPPELREIEVRANAIRQQMAGLLNEESEYKSSLANIENAMEKLNDRLLNEELDFDADVAAKKELRKLREMRSATIRYLGRIAERKETVEDKWSVQQDLKRFAEQTIALKQAREAEVREREVRAKEAQEQQQQQRWKAASDAWESNYQSVSSEGDPVPTELVDEFKELALKHIYESSKGAPPNPADVPKLMREAKAKFDKRVELFHTVKSRMFAERKEKDLQVTQTAPDPKVATAPGVKKRDFADEDEWSAAIRQRYERISPPQ